MAANIGAALYDIITNKVLVIPLCAWAIAQSLKVFIGLVREKHLDLHYFVASGGMPSAHTALVCSLAATLAILEGLDSVVFAITAILAMVVMYDAAGVRQSVSEQSVILNRIVREFGTKRLKGEMERDLRELIGHTPFQVIMGALLGIFVSWFWLILIGLAV